MALRSLRILALVLALTASAAAQFQGYFSPQTTQQTLATAALCAGVPQTYPIVNLGQTQHWLSVAFNNSQTFHGEIDGIDRQGNVFRISDVMETASAKGVVIGTGYYPQIQVVITCAPTSASYTASYSGAWGTPFNDVGHTLFAQIDKTNFSASPENTGVSDTLQTPFGSSAGTIYFQYATAAISGSTLTVTCNPSGALAGSGVIVLQPLIASATTLQSFNIPNYPCPSITVSYTSGGGGAGTISAEYVFAPPGALAGSFDPCTNGYGTIGSQVNPKTSVAVAAVSGAGTTAVISTASNQAIYVCGFQLSQLTTAGTIQLETGSGTNCGTGTAPLTGAMGVTASQPITYGNGGSSLFPGSNHIGGGDNQICIAATGGGTVSGVITYVIAP